jgi:hypothetical protein
MKNLLFLSYPQITQITQVAERTTTGVEQFHVLTESVNSA